VLEVTPRRKYVWRSLGPQGISFSEIAREFKELLKMPFSSVPGRPLRQFGGRDAAETHHRCRGYVREEITLTTSLISKVVISYATPAWEIGVVYKEMGQGGEIFAFLFQSER